MRKKKISLIGAGQIGGTLALFIAQKAAADIVLVDIREDIAKAKALDILHASAIFNTDIDIVGTKDYSLTKNSDVYIVSAGLSRRPGMSRDDLLKSNAAVIKEISKNIKRYSPHSFVIIITNPLDAMSQLAKTVTEFPKNRVIGMAGVLDSARFRAFLSKELKVSVSKIDTMVLGAHGDSMVPLSRYSKVADSPVSDSLTPDKLNAIMDRVRKAGAEIISLLKTGSAYYSPAASAYKMLEAILDDKKETLPCSAYLEGEYGVNGYYMGVPVVLGAGGIERIVELELTEEEKQLFKKSFSSCRANVETLKKFNFL